MEIFSSPLKTFHPSTMRHRVSTMPSGLKQSRGCSVEIGFLSKNSSLSLEYMCSMLSFHPLLVERAEDRVSNRFVRKTIPFALRFLPILLHTALLHPWRSTISNLL